MTNWEALTATPDDLIWALDESHSMCFMEHIGYDCTKDENVASRCPLYNRAGTCKEKIREWLQEEAS